VIAAFPLTASHLNATQSSSLYCIQTANGGLVINASLLSLLRPNWRRLQRRSPIETQRLCMAARVGVEARKARKEWEAASEAASLPVREALRLGAGRCLAESFIRAEPQELGRGRSRVLPN
jgi:hypothetical protein